MPADVIFRLVPIEAPCLELLFVERESAELRALRVSLGGAGGALMMLSTPAQAGLMLDAASRQRRPELLLVEGGLADGRADALVDFARGSAAFSTLRSVVFIDMPGARRRAFKLLAASGVAAGPWLFAKFL